ncbi:hypothetical protein TNCV_4235341 [Trichonephila clavipes]|nr:hypothetical protein TNCV_4235341 [Trichonephila clavipes]
MYPSTLSIEIISDVEFSRRLVKSRSDKPRQVKSSVCLHRTMVSVTEKLLSYGDTLSSKTREEKQFNSAQSAPPAHYGRRKQFNSAAGRKQLDSVEGRKQLDSVAGEKQLNSATGEKQLNSAGGGKQLDYVPSVPSVTVESAFIIYYHY